MYIPAPSGASFSGLFSGFPCIYSIPQSAGKVFIYAVFPHVCNCEKQSLIKRYVWLGVYFLFLHPSAAFILHDSVQLSGFGLYRSLTLMHDLYAISVRQTRDLPVRLVSSRASGFLQIPPHDGHPCLRLYPSRCRADSGLAPVRNVRRRAHQKKRRHRVSFSMYNQKISTPPVLTFLSSSFLSIRIVHHFSPLVKLNHFFLQKKHFYSFIYIIFMTQRSFQSLHFSPLLIRLIPCLVFSSFTLSSQFFQVWYKLITFV